MALLGVDVSNWQGDFDWSQAKEKGWKFAFAKATEGTNYIDPYFNRNMAQMDQHGLIRGAYMFWHPAQNWLKQCQLFDRVVSAAGLRRGDLISLDHETDDGLPPDRVAESAVNACGYLEAKYKCSPIVYSYQNFIQRGNCTGLGKYPFWRADPGGYNMPVLPPWTEVSIDQYATSPEDQDRAYFTTTAQLELLAVGSKETDINMFPGNWRHFIGCYTDSQGNLNIVGIGTDYQVYEIKRQDGKWGKPYLIGAKVNMI